MFTVIRTTVAVSIIGLGLFALAVPAQAQDVRGKGFAAPKAERSEAPSRFQRINIPKAEREDSRRIEVESRQQAQFIPPKAERFERPKAERSENLVKPARFEFQAPKAERSEHVQRSEAPARQKFADGAESAPAEPEEAPAEIIEDAPAPAPKAEESIGGVAKKVIRRVIYVRSRSYYDDNYGYDHDDDYGYGYSDAGYDSSYGYDSCY